MAKRIKKQATKGYTVNVKGQGVILVTELEKAELIRQVCYLMDAMEDIDIISNKLADRVKKWREGCPK